LHTMYPLFFSTGITGNISEDLTFALKYIDCAPLDAAQLVAAGHLRGHIDTPDHPSPRDMLALFPNTLGDYFSFRSDTWTTDFPDHHSFPVFMSLPGSEELLELYAVDPVHSSHSSPSYGVRLHRNRDIVSASDPHLPISRHASPARSRPRSPETPEAGPCPSPPTPSVELASLGNLTLSSTSSSSSSSVTRRSSSDLTAGSFRLELDTLVRRERTAAIAREGQLRDSLTSSISALQTCTSEANAVLFQMISEIRSEIRLLRSQPPTPPPPDPST
jgi:hypothetical protein